MHRLIKHGNTKRILKDEKKDIESPHRKEVLIRKRDNDHEHNAILIPVKLP
jgi:hypothetical protein